MPDKFAWDENSPVLFQTAMSSNIVQSMMSNFTNTAYDSTTINTAVDDLNNIIITAANMSLKRKKIFNSSKPKKKRNKPWFDKDLNLMKRELSHKCSLMQKYSRDPYVRGSFLNISSFNEKQEK